MKPINFNTQMVKAILQGLKCQTRRPEKFPAMEVGDTLWVREAYRVAKAYDALPPSRLPNGCEICFLSDEFKGSPYMKPKKADLQGDGGLGLDLVEKIRNAILSSINKLEGGE